MLFIAAGVFVYLAVTVSNIVTREPPPRRQNTRRRTRRPSAEDSTADRLAHAARLTGDRQHHFAWMDIGTITGKLTFGSWMSRWWASGSYMRRRLLVSIGTALLTVVVLSAVVALLA